MQLRQHNGVRTFKTVRTTSWKYVPLQHQWRHQQKWQVKLCRTLEINKGWQQAQFIQGQRPNFSKNSDAPGALTCPGAFPLTPSPWGPKTNSLRTTGDPRSSSPDASGWGRTGWKLPKLPPWGTGTLQPVWSSLETLTAKAVPYWTSLRSHRLWAIFFHTYFENNQWRLFNITAAWEGSTIWTKHKAHQK